MEKEPSGPQERLVVFTRASRQDLVEVYLYNEARNGSAHADEYLEFLLSSIQTLADGAKTGKEVDGFPGVFCFMAKKSRKRSAYGHCILYRLKNLTVEVLRVVHSSSDWMGGF